MEDLTKTALGEDSECEYDIVLHTWYQYLSRTECFARGPGRLELDGYLQFTQENTGASFRKQVAEFGLNCKKSYENTQVFVHHPKCFSVSPETSLCHSSFIFYWLRVFPLRKLNTTENSLKLHHTFPCLRCYTEWGHFPEVPLSQG